jgi:hypothetical protein
MFTQQTGAEMVHVPYRGTGPALADILAGNVDLFFDNLGSSMPMHRGGKAKVLAVATPERSKLLPEVPTLREAGLRDFSSSTWFAIVAPPGTPAAIADQINKAVNDVLAMPDIQAQFETLGVQPRIVTPTGACGVHRRRGAALGRRRPRRQDREGIATSRPRNCARSLPADSDPTGRTSPPADDCHPSSPG